MDASNISEGIPHIPDNQQMHGHIDGRVLLAQQPKDHSQDIKKDAHPEKTKARLEAFMKDSGKISELLTEGKFGKVRAFLDRHPVLTVALGGAVLATAGAISLAGTAVILGGFVLSPVLLFAPFFLPLGAPALLVATACLLTPGFVIAPLIGLAAGAGIGLGAAALGSLGGTLVGAPIDKWLNKESNFQKRLTDAGISPQERELAKQHLKRAKFLHKSSEYIEPRAELALRIKNNNSLSDDSKRELLTGLANKVNTQTLNHEYQLAEKWSGNLTRDDPLVKSLAALLPEAVVDEIIHTPVDSESYTKRCEKAFTALVKSPYVRAVQAQHSLPELGHFHAREVEQLAEIARIGKDEYVRLQMLHFTHDQLQSIQSAEAA